MEDVSVSVVEERAGKSGEIPQENNPKLKGFNTLELAFKYWEKKQNRGQNNKEGK